MTYEEFKEECYRIRDLRKERKDLIIQLLTLDDHKFDKVSNGVVDTTREYTKKSLSSDDRIINALVSCEEKKAYIKSRLDNLPEINEDLESLLMDVNGTAGMIIFFYLLQDEPMKTIAKGLNHTPKYCFDLMNRKLKDLYLQYCEEQND